VDKAILNGFLWQIAGVAVVAVTCPRFVPVPMRESTSNMLVGRIEGRAVDVDLRLAREGVERQQALDLAIGGMQFQ
jgi:hypothetical protein